MSCQTLLPSNQKSFVKQLDKATCDALQQVDEDVIRKVWRPSECPLEFLPFLAWAVGVDEWDDAWSEDVKRKTVAESVWLHWHKGTNPAITDALSRLGLPFEYTEWWQQVPRGRRGTATIRFYSKSQSLGEEFYTKLDRLLRTVKRGTIHHSVSLESGFVAHGYVGVAMRIKTRSAIYPGKGLSPVRSKSYLGVGVRFKVRSAIHPAIENDDIEFQPLFVDLVL